MSDMNDEELARKSAWILGPASAAAQALKELDRRRAEGENVHIISQGSYWLVGQTPPEGEGRTS